MSLEKLSCSHTSLHVKEEEVRCVFMFLKYLQQITEFTQLGQHVNLGFGGFQKEDNFYQIKRH